MGTKALLIRFNKTDGFIKIHDKIRSLVSFDYRYCDKTCDKIKYLISEKSYMILQIVLIIFLQESELILILLTYRKNNDF